MTSAPAFSTIFFRCRIAGNTLVIVGIPQQDDYEFLHPCRVVEPYASSSLWFISGIECAKAGLLAYSLKSLLNR